MTLKDNVNDSFKDNVQKWFDKGFNVVLTKARNPNIQEWKRWQDQRQTQEEFESLPWSQADGFGLVCGFNRLYVLDVDDSSFDYPKFLKAYPTLADKSHGKHNGFHFLFTSDCETSKNCDFENIELLGKGQIVVMDCDFLSNFEIHNFLDVGAVFPRIASDYGFKHRVLSKIAVSNKPVEELLSKGVAEGERDNIAIFLASKLRFEGKSKDETTALLLAWNKLNTPPLPDQTVLQKVESAFKNGEPYFSKKEKQLKKRAFSLPDAESCFDSSGKEKFLLWSNGVFSLVDEINKVYPKTLAKTYDTEKFQIPKDYDVSATPNIQNVYERVHGLISRYVDLRSEFVVLLSLFVLLSYFQNHFSWLPYIQIIGDVGSGKTVLASLLAILCFHGYLAVCVNGSDIFHLLKIYGKGNLTLFEDEIQGFEKDDDKVKIYKSGNYINGNVPRIFSKTNELIFYPTFCLKALIGEQHAQNKGVIDRSIDVEMSKGTPKNSFYGESLSEPFLNEVRSLKVDLLKLKLTVKPQILHSTNRLENTLNPLRSMDNYLSCKLDFENWCNSYIEFYEQKRKNTLEGALAEVIFSIIDRQDFLSDPLLSALNIKFETIWNKLTKALDGTLDAFKTWIFHSNDFGDITKNQIGRKLNDVFHSNKKKKRFDEDVVCVHEFDVETLLKVLSAYFTEDEVQLIKLKIKEKTSGQNGNA